MFENGDGIKLRCACQSLLSLVFTIRMVDLAIHLVVCNVRTVVEPKAGSNGIIKHTPLVHVVKPYVSKCRSPIRKLHVVAVYCLCPTSSDFACHGLYLMSALL